MGTDAPLVVPDYRRPGQAMVSVPIKLPPDLLEALQHRAERLGCSRGALGRALIAQGLERLETAAAAWGETTPAEAELERSEGEGRRVLAEEAKAAGRSKPD
jgi:predicted transcriptional regulator